MNFTPQKWMALIRKSRLAFSVVTAWLAGVTSGGLLAVLVGSTYYSVLETAVSCPASPAGLAAGIVLPAALIVVAARSKLRWLLCLTVLFKVTSVTACSIGLQGVYGSAGWLVRLFVQFSDMLTLPVFCWLSLRGAKKPISKTVCGAAAVWYLLVCLADYCVISPFFAGLIVK